MKACSSFVISVSGRYIDIFEAVDFLSEIITDQSCWTEFTHDCVDNDPDDYDDDDYDWSSDSDWDWDSGSDWDSGGTDWDSDW